MYYSLDIICLRIHIRKALVQYTRAKGPCMKSRPFLLQKAEICSYTTEAAPWSQCIKPEKMKMIINNIA